MESERVAPGRIVVGVDGSQHAKRALTWAAEQAVLEGRPLTVAHAAGEGDVRTAARAGVEGAVLYNLRDVLASAREVVRDAVSFARSAHPGIEVHGLPRVGDARHVLVELSGLSEKFPDVHVTLQLGYGLIDECLTRGPRPRDLIVVGRHPVHTLSKLLAGSISTAVLERSDSPVAVVPEAETTTEEEVSK
jgi:nucleotide-binding universal stress UspA family protein